MSARELTELAAVLVTDLNDGDKSESLMIFVWRDCAMTINFLSGRRMYVPPGHGQSLDSTVRQIAVQAITKYCQGAGIAVAEIRVHMVPPEASTSEQIFAWFQSIPGISITILPLKEIGFGGPVPPAGEAG